MASMTGARLLALVKAATGTVEWHRIADTVDDLGSLDPIYSGDLTGFESTTAMDLARIAATIQDSAVQEFEELIEAQASRQVRLVTILDADYPTNLRQIFNRPPFLFVRGLFLPDDSRSVAVVGTREATAAGLRAATTLARDLARQGVTVLSGLARGIDSAAHKAALEAGGRTIAVMGTGIERVYPEENRELANLIGETGALVSQFWPDAPPTKYTFPMRNVVMSGLGFGTVVIEASSTSGAKMQARLALEHGKRVFLLRSLVMSQEWATKYADRPGAEVVDSVDDIVSSLIPMSASGAEQLRLV